MKVAFVIASVLFASAGAQAMTCRSSNLKFDLSPSAFSNIETPLERVRADMEEASRRGLELVPQSHQGDSFTVMFDGQFTSPSPMGIGSVRVLLNEATGEGRFDWDDDDGSGISIDLVCR